MSGALKPGVPVGAEEFDLLLKKFSPLSDKIAVAVSGGADSMALALCVARWAQRPCLAFIVDHGLREESATEAHAVKARLEAMGLTAEILPWHHETIETRIEQKGRAARYELLIAACKRKDIGDLLIAHHAEDQAETVLLRMSKGSGIDGLAGIAAESLREDIRLLRPFLPLPKERLVATCAQAKIDCVSDPSNASSQFARARLRKILPLLSEEGLTKGNLAYLAAHARVAKEALDFYTDKFLTHAAATEIGGHVRLERQSLHDVPRAIALRALSACLRYVHEANYWPEPDSLSTLLDKIFSAEPEITRTFYGCIISTTADRVSILREPAAATEVLPLVPGATILWDKRWLVTAPQETKATEIRALGMQTHDVVDRLAPHLRRQVPQGRVRASLPSLWQKETIVAIPSFNAQAMPNMIYKKSAVL